MSLSFELNSDYKQIYKEFDLKWKLSSDDYYYIEPPISEITIWGKSKLKTHSQVIVKSFNNETKVSNNKTAIKIHEKVNLSPIKQTPMKDMFGNIIVPKKTFIPRDKKLELKVHFKYQEGFTNAVKRNVYINDFL